MKLREAFGTPYDHLIASAAAAHNIEYSLLWRLLYQESRFRPDIINGQTRSSTGALGIAQFMPATAAEMGIDPLNPEQAIPAAAAYLRRLMEAFGNVDLAVAAYNWGWGNVRSWRNTGKGARGQTMPQETIDYVAAITGGTLA